MNKRISFFILGCLIVVTLVGCNAKAEDNLEKTAQNIVEQEEKPSNTKENKELLEKILVTYKADSLIQDNKQRMIVNIENKTDKVFTGNIHIDFEDENGKIIGNDMAIVEDLRTGTSTWCNIYIEPTLESNINMDYSFSQEFNFADDGMSDGMSDGILNEELSVDISESVKDSFGNEFFTADWYQFIEKIEAYSSADKHYAIVIVTTQDEEISDDIGNIIFGNFAYGEDAKISKVIVKDETDNVVFMRSK